MYVLSSLLTTINTELWKKHSSKRRNRSEPMHGKLFVWLSALLLVLYLWSYNGKETGITQTREYPKGNRQHSSVVFNLLQIIHINYDEYFILTAFSELRSVKPHFVNNNYIQTSSVAFDYAKFLNILSGVSQEREIERLGFLRICIRKYTFVMIELFHDTPVE